ncbi:hypothetical protein BaRGS_00030170 [Batillaria attramentaria]|uniref:Uncharacterized protein n=1 Tax=Batillaria attramentaria TaxID=370345 RepID=A0ABD0JV48_9CAEN
MYHVSVSSQLKLCRIPQTAFGWFADMETVITMILFHVLFPGLPRTSTTKVYCNCINVVIYGRAHYAQAYHRNKRSDSKSCIELMSELRTVTCRKALTINEFSQTTEDANMRIGFNEFSF